MANEKAEQLKPQAWMSEHGFRDGTVYNLEGVPVCTISDVLAQFAAAHAPSGSPRNEVLSRLECEWDSGPDTDEHVYRLLAKAFDAGSVASQEAPGEGKFCTECDDQESCYLSGLCKKKIGVASQEAAQPGFPIDKTDDWEERQDRARPSQEAVCPACGSGDRERAITQLNSLPLSVCPHKWHKASQEAAQPCHKATEYHLIAGASQYACMLQKGHKGKCQPGGTCVMHGPYIGLHNGLVQCPQWPLCIEIPKVAAGTPAKE